MPTIVETVIRDGETINIYESGAQYNATRGHLVKAPDHAAFTPETSLKAKERLAELKREAILRGASKALEKKQPDEWDTPNSLDVVEAIGEAITMKALNPDNPKQVDAARFILQESGMAESQTSSNVPTSNFGALGSDFASFARSIAQIVSDVLSAKQAEQLHDTIDGKVSD